MSTLPASWFFERSSRYDRCHSSGTLHALRVAADAVAVDGDDGAIRRAGGMNRLRVPGEDALHPLRQTALALRDELQIAEASTPCAEESLGDRARGVDVRPSGCARSSGMCR